MRYTPENVPIKTSVHIMETGEVIGQVFMVDTGAMAVHCYESPSQIVERGCRAEVARYFAGIIPVFSGRHGLFMCYGELYDLDRAMAAVRDPKNSELFAIAATLTANGIPCRDAVKAVAETYTLHRRRGAPPNPAGAT